MRRVTLVLPVDGSNVLLAMKKKGFGMGQWNGFGGNVEDYDSSLEAAAVRELKEESKLVADPADLSEIADISFYFTDHPEWNQRMLVYLLRKWAGEPVETDEMKPFWFHERLVPYRSMWLADEGWMPLALRGDYVQAEVTYEGKGELISRFYFIQPEGHTMPKKIARRLMKIKR